MRANCEQPGARQADVFLRVYFARKIHFTAFFSRRARAGVCRARPFGVLNMCRASRALAAFQRFCGWKGGAPHGIPCNKAWCGHCGPLAGAGRRAGGLSAQPRRVGACIAGRVSGGRIRRPCPPAGLCQAVYRQAPCIGALGPSVPLCAPLSPAVRHRLPHSGDAALPLGRRMRADVLKLRRFSHFARV